MAGRMSWCDRVLRVLRVMRRGAEQQPLLFGAHAFWLHPWFVAWAWWKLYGFPWDPRLWVAFIVHDWGYWGLSAMDDEEGEKHPKIGAAIMHWLFDRGVEEIPVGPGKWYIGPNLNIEIESWDGGGTIIAVKWDWYNLVYYHSRFLSKRNNHEPSKLCYADKLAIALTPWWLYLPMTRITEEIREYRKIVKHVEDLGYAWNTDSWHDDRAWFQFLQRRMAEFAWEQSKSVA